MLSKIHPFLYLCALLSMATHLDAEETIHVSESVQNILKARDAIREGRKSGEIPADSPVTVVIKPGIYQIHESLVFGALDGRVTYRAEKPGTVSFRGGSTLSSEKFAKISDQKILKRLSESVHDKVFVYDLAEIVSKELPTYPNSFKGMPPAR